MQKIINITVSLWYKGTALGYIITLKRPPRVCLHIWSKSHCQSDPPPHSCSVQTLLYLVLEYPEGRHVKCALCNFTITVITVCSDPLVVAVLMYWNKMIQLYFTTHFLLHTCLCVSLLGLRTDSKIIQTNLNTFSHHICVLGTCSYKNSSSQNLTP